MCICQTYVTRHQQDTDLEELQSNSHQQTLRNYAQLLQLRNCNYILAKYENATETERMITLEAPSVVLVGGGGMDEKEYGWKIN